MVFDGLTFFQPLPIGSALICGAVASAGAAWDAAFCCAWALLRVRDATVMAATKVTAVSLALARQLIGRIGRSYAEFGALKACRTRLPGNRPSGLQVRGEAVGSALKT